jgi:hypothetical protein
MTTRKQEKRRRKRLVHGVPVSDAPQRSAREPRPKPTRPDRRPGGRGTRARRSVPEPSLKRSFRKALLLLGGFFVLMYVLVARNQNRSLLPFVIEGVPVVILAGFMDYYLSKYMWRRFGQAQQAGTRK